LIQNPQLGQLRKPYFNDYPSGVEKQKVKVCVNEGFTNQEEYGLCPTGGIYKSDPMGSNCPTPLIECEETEYGCCSDNQTAKINEEGENCPVLDSSVCLKSK